MYMAFAHAHNFRHQDQPSRQPRHLSLITFLDVSAVYVVLCILLCLEGTLAYLATVLCDIHSYIQSSTQVHSSKARPTMPAFLLVI